MADSRPPQLLCSMNAWSFVMAYMLLILEQRGDRQARGSEGGRDAYAAMLRFRDNLKARGLHISSDALRGDYQGVRVEQRDGKRVLVDGPFAESKEMIGGYFLVNCATKEEAIELAAECPASAWAKIEVREIGTCFEDLA
jgi:hypothetical protein